MLVEIAKYVVPSVLISTTIVGALAWLLRSWISARLKSAIQHEYDAKLATHKAQLQASSDVEIEKLRSHLSIVAAVRQIRFTKLHEVRAEVIAETMNPPAFPGDSKP